MRIEIRLSDEDRERLGVSSEWIEYDHDRVGIRLLAEVQKTLSLTIPEFDRGIALGNALAVWGLAWIAVRMSGVDVKLEDFEFQANVARMRYPDVATEEVEPGKDDPSTPSTGTPTPKRSQTTKTSTRSSATTRSRSRT